MAGGGIALYDPGLSSTAVCRSAITHIDGEAGILQHRGYRIEALCERSNFLELAYLLINGELPTAGQFESWLHEIGTRNFVHENVKGFIEGFRYDARPIAMVAASVGALSSFYTDADQVYDENARELQVVRLLAKLPTLAAFSYRHLQGLPYVHPEDHLSYTGNLLSMMFRMSELRYTPDPVVERALDVLLMLHADHEQNASTTAVRAVGSTHVNPYAAVAAGVTALSGPMRGGAAQDVLTMLRRIGSPSHVTEFLARVKSAHERLLGFGHWVYTTYDPRARCSAGSSSSSTSAAGSTRCSRSPTNSNNKCWPTSTSPRASCTQTSICTRPYIRGARHRAADVPGDVRARPQRRMDRAVGRDGQGPGADDVQAASAVHRRAGPRVRGRPRARLSAGRTWRQSSGRLHYEPGGGGPCSHQRRPLPAESGGRGRVRRLLARPAPTHAAASRRYLVVSLPAGLWTGRQRTATDRTFGSSRSGGRPLALASEPHTAERAG